ncbi:TGF-beta receptor type-2-like [Parambassis ranga]|uniref:TGF-beta receptor type-2-like n=1 Tax=Parambassis ranga TaxID=210632 RepID=A0A6P7H4J0_9TELE|nr:TGF-beta receptor type-2-like [Parambassis ranga]
MMGQCRTCWTGILILLPACLQSVMVSQSPPLCMVCDGSSPVCKAGVCRSNCDMVAICFSYEDICVAIWRETNNTVTVQTMCHNRTLPLEGVDPGLRLLNSVSTECHMVPQPTKEGAVMVCGCDSDECNDEFHLHKELSGLRGRDLILVVVISLSPVLVTIVTAVTLYFYYKRRGS